MDDPSTRATLSAGHKMCKVYDKDQGKRESQTRYQPCIYFRKHNRFSTEVVLSSSSHSSGPDSDFEHQRQEGSIGMMYFLYLWARKEPSFCN